MKENHVDDQFSLALDGELGPREEREFNAHLAGCERCSTAFSRLQRSVQAMQRAAVPALSADVLKDTVAAAFPEISSAARPAPALRPQGRGTPWPMVLSHAAAVLVGCTLMFGGRAAFFGGGPAPTPLPPERIEVPVEVIREVKVEVPVEVIVEVPKEVIREVRVEVPVEVPVEVAIETVIERRVPHPLQRRLDAGYGVASNISEVALLTARGLGGAFEMASRQEAVHIANASDGVPGEATSARQAAESEGARRRSRRDALSGDSRGSRTSALVIQRDGERLSLRTRGPREVVVPALIDALEGSDPALADAALGQLMSIRGRMVESGLDTGAFPETSARTSMSFDEPIDQAGGIRGLLRQSRARGREVTDLSPEPASADAWRRWWRAASSGE